jgi:hypothetical protein
MILLMIEGVRNDGKGGAPGRLMRGASSSAGRFGVLGDYDRCALVE